MADYSVAAQQTVLLCIRQRAAVGPHAGRRSMQLFAGALVSEDFYEDFYELGEDRERRCQIIGQSFFLFC
jgi:hypothetical protein